MKKSTVVSLILLVGVLSANAELHTQIIEYKQGDTVLEGFLAYDKAIHGKRPGVLIVHQWKGLGSYEKKRAEMLANLGYTVFALDIYGKGIRADNPKDASALAAKYKNDRALLRERAKSGLGILKKHELTDPERIALILRVPADGPIAKLSQARPSPRSQADIVFGRLSLRLFSPSPSPCVRVTRAAPATRGMASPAC